jgi:membrane protein YdbS with pleckstrin-like domain
MKQLHKNAIWLFFFSYARRYAIAVFIISFWLAAKVRDYGSGEIAAAPIAMFALSSTVACLVGCYVWARLSYRYYRYELSDQGLKKEHGIIFKRYVTIPYGKIQNIDIYRGLLDRMLGLSQLEIQTAGEAGRASRRGITFSEASLPGVSIDEAEMLRSSLAQRAEK